MQQILAKLKSSHSGSQQKPIRLTVGKRDFAFLMKYLSLCMALRAWIRQSQGLFSQSKSAESIEGLLAYLPGFVRQGDESAFSLQTRITSEGLTVSEVDDMLQVISLECVVHARRTDKASLLPFPNMSRQLLSCQNTEKRPRKRTTVETCPDTSTHHEAKVGNPSTFKKVSAPKQKNPVTRQKSQVNATSEGAFALDRNF